jgi:thymidine kinase
VDDLVLLGAKNEYEPLCRTCYLKVASRKN